MFVPVLAFAALVFVAVVSLAGAVALASLKALARHLGGP